MRRRLLIAAAFAGLALRGGYAWRQYAKVYEPIDSYEIYARAILERGELSAEPGKLTSLREPGYPLLIAGLYTVSGGRHAWVVLAAHALMALAIAAMLADLGGALFGPGVGAAAFIAYMLYPQSIYYSAAMFRDTFSSFLFAVAIWAAFRAPREKERAARGWTFLSGVAAGVLAVTSTAGALAAVPACGLSFVSAGPWRARLRRAAVFLAPIFICVVPWTVRNWNVHHRLIFGNTEGGGEIYQAMIIEPDDLGTERQGEILDADEYWHAVQDHPEAQRNAELTRKTMELALADPLLYARRVAARVVKLWRLWPYRRAYDHSYRDIVLASLVSDAWMVPLGLLGFVLLRKRWREAPAAPLAVGFLTAVYALLHAVIRYRLPAMSFVILSAVACVAELWRRQTEKKIPPRVKRR